jgi:hypothetical protein
MSKNVAKLVIALFFLSSLFVTSGQNRLIATQDGSVSAPQAQAAPAVLVPQLNKYGSLVGLKDVTGKDLLKEIKHRWREGYAIAYQAKDLKGVYKDRFVYVMGDRVSARKLKVEDQKSTISRKVVATADAALEIGRVIIWDEKAHALKSDVTIINTSNREVILRALEIGIDKSVAARLIAEGKGWPPNSYDIIGPNCPLPLPYQAYQASMECMEGDECNPCPCGSLCTPKPGQARIFDRDPLNRRPVNIEDLIGPKLPEFKGPMMCLSWAGSNLSRSVLKPGEQILVHYRLIIPQP